MAVNKIKDVVSKVPISYGITACERNPQAIIMDIKQENSNSNSNDSNDRWEKNMQKKLRNSGEEYINKQGKLIMKKEPPEEISCKCKFSCDMLKLNYRKKLWKDFYEMGNYDKQQSYMREYIQASPVRQRRGGTYDDPADSRRQKTFKYFLPLPDGGKARVCQKTFRDTFALKSGRIQHLALKIAAGQIDVTDNRGGRQKFKTLDWTEKIREHIVSFPTEKGHCDLCDSPNNSYLSPDLNLSILFKHFLENYRDDGTKEKPPVSRTMYSNVFRKYSKLSFRRPSVIDTCSNCNELQIAIEDAQDDESKETARLNQSKHHTQVEISQKQLKADTKNPDYYVACFDLEQQIALPAFTNSQMYFSRQLNCYNLGIHDERRRKGVICLWTEDCGGCESTEIGSCLYQYFTEEVTTISNEKLVLWSDKCAGDDRSRFLIAMYMTLVAKGYFEEITHKFLLKGHAYTSCSKDFGLIEKKKRITKLFTIKDVAELIRGTTEKHPFEIILVNGFIEWKLVAANAFVKVNNLQIGEAAQIRVTKKNFGFVDVSYDYSNDSWNSKKILKKGCDLSYFQQLKLEKTNTSEGLSAEKKTDLRAMFPYLSSDVKEYFVSILEK